MKKALLALGAIMLLSGCVGFVDGKSSSGKTTHDMYVLHPAITISGYTSGL
ncbi:MAG: hypothetical protein LBJ18_01155 [Rickettsiales bacterium]|jgi:PBP1b-binding outer membrane lipoprotein LpoB|nr:hypothetical protein [Rickettsiales bacterium]